MPDSLSSSRSCEEPDSSNGSSSPEEPDISSSATGSPSCEGPSSEGPSSSGSPGSHEGSGSSDDSSHPCDFRHGPRIASTPDPLRH